MSEIPGKRGIASRTVSRFTSRDGTTPARFLLARGIPRRTTSPSREKQRPRVTLIGGNRRGTRRWISRVSSEKRDSEAAIFQDPSRRLASLLPSRRRKYNSSGGTPGDTLTAATGTRGTAPSVSGPGSGFYSRERASDGTKRGVHRLTAAGIDSCTFLSRPLRILPGVVDVTRGPRGSLPPLELVSGARTPSESL